MHNLPRRVARYALKHGSRAFFATAASSKFASLAVRNRHPSRVLAFGGGIGDDLLCTIVLREWRKRSSDRVLMLTRFPELFEHSTDVEFVVSSIAGYEVARRLPRARVYVPWYTSYDPIADIEVSPTQHIIAKMCAGAGIDGLIELRPHWTVTPCEHESWRLGEMQVAVQSTGMSKASAFPNKEWLPERFQSVVDSSCGSIKWVQIGLKSDYPLSGAVDLRGKTSLRETAAILANSICFVGLVGFLMHLARAVDCRSVIVYGGREHPDQSGYSANVNLASYLDCAPCWRRRTCEFDRVCMKSISHKAVNNALAEVIGDRLEVLPIQEAVVTGLEWSSVHTERLDYVVGSRRCNL